MAKFDVQSEKNAWLSLKSIPQEFYNRDTRFVAIELLGKYLIHQLGNNILVGKIVETEAYLGEIDPACHAFTGYSKRNSAFDQPGGYSYIYLNYGKHFLLNVITNPPSSNCAILIIALEQLSDLDVMKTNRMVTKEKDLTNGPGKLCQAFQITINHNKQSLIDGPLSIKSDNEPLEYNSVGISARIGISKASSWKLRYFLICFRFVYGIKSVYFDFIYDLSLLP